MAEYGEAVKPVAQTPAAGRGGLIDCARQLTYAWLGMFGLAGDEFGGFYNRCVARGEQTVKARQLAVRLNVKSQAPELTASEPVDGAPDNTVTATGTVMNAFVVFSSNVVVRPKSEGRATRAEIDALIERVDALSREVDALADQRNQEE